MKFVKVLFVALGMMLSVSSYAAVSPLSISVFPPAQFPPSDFTTTGLRASVLWGDHRDLYGFDIGAIGNITEHGFGGIGFSGVFNITHGQTAGMQVAGLFNLNTGKADLYGLQFSGLLNRNTAASSLLGVQLAIANLSDFTNITGFQIGLFNRALNVNGFQIGLINMTKNLHGIQIGLLNFYTQGLFIVSPVINIGFN